MLETIFEWLSSGIAEACEGIINVVLGMLRLDIRTVAVNFPILGTAFTIFRAVGIGIAVAIAIFSISKFAFGSLVESKDTPTQILFRTAVSIFLIYFGTYALEWIVNITKIPYDALLLTDAAEAGNLFRMASAGELVEGVTVTGTVTAGAVVGGAVVGQALVLGTVATLILYLILVLVIAYNLAKLLIEVFQRFVWLIVLLYSSPLAFATFSSRTTSQILSKFFNMFLSQCLLMVMSVWMLKAAVSGFNVIEDEQVVQSGLLFRYFLTLAMCKVGMTMDREIQKLALNAATTAGNVLDEAARDFLLLMRPYHRGNTHTVMGTTAGAVSSAYSAYSQYKESHREDPSAAAMKGMGATVGTDGSVSVKTSGHDLRKEGSGDDEYMTATKASVLGAGMMNMAGDPDFKQGRGASFAKNTIERASQGAARSALFDDNLSKDIAPGTNDTTANLLVRRAMGDTNPLALRGNDARDPSSGIKNFASRSVGVGGRLSEFDYTNADGVNMHGQLANSAYIDSLPPTEQKKWTALDPVKTSDGSIVSALQGYYRSSRDFTRAEDAQARLFSGSSEGSGQQKADVVSAFGSTISGMDPTSVSHVSVRRDPVTNASVTRFNYREGKEYKTATISDQKIRDADGHEIPNQTWVAKQTDDGGHGVGGYYISTIPATPKRTDTSTRSRAPRTEGSGREVRENYSSPERGPTEGPTGSQSRSSPTREHHSEQSRVVDASTIQTYSEERRYTEKPSSPMQPSSGRGKKKRNSDEGKK